MRRYAVAVGLSLIGVGLLMLVLPALAGEDLPFEFVVETRERVSEQGNSWTTVGTGHATHMGDVTFIVEVTQHGNKAESWRTVEAADGDLLFLYAQTEYDETLGRFVGIYTITGGTGRFEGATGSGIQEATAGCYGTISF